MGSFSIWHWLVVFGIVLLLFGTGRVSNLMGDLAKGVKAFKKGLQEEEEPTPDKTTTDRTANDKPRALSSDEADAAAAKKDEAHHH